MNDERGETGEERGIKRRVRGGGATLVAADGEGSRYHLLSESHELLHPESFTLFLQGPPWETHQPRNPGTQSLV